MSISRGQFTLRLSSSTVGWAAGRYILEKHPPEARSTQRFGALTVDDLVDIVSVCGQAVRQIKADTKT